MEQVDHAEIARTMAQHPARKGLVLNVALTALEVGGSIVLFDLALGRGASEVQAYLVGTIAPVLGGLVVWVRSRTFSGASAAVFSFTALSAAVAVIGSTDPRVLLYKDCAITALIGVIFGLSCFLLPRPVMFSFAQRYSTDGTREGMSVFDAMWLAYPGFRRVMYQVSLVWTVVFVVQAGVTALIIATSPFSTAYAWDQILPVVATVLAMVLTVVISTRARRTGEAARRRVAVSAG